MGDIKHTIHPLTRSRQKKRITPGKPDLDTNTDVDEKTTKEISSVKNSSQNKKIFQILVTLQRVLNLHDFFFDYKDYMTASCSYIMELLIYCVSNL